MRQPDPHARILMFTMHANATYAQKAFRAGARGYITKSSLPDALVSAIRDVHAGRTALCDEINGVIAASRADRRRLACRARRSIRYRARLRVHEAGISRAGSFARRRLAAGLCNFSLIRMCNAATNVCVREQVPLA